VCQQRADLPFSDKGREKGHSKLFDLKGAPLPGKTLGTRQNVAEQNKAVQDYLKRKGGILEITQVSGGRRDRRRHLDYRETTGVYQYV